MEFLVAPFVFPLCMHLQSFSTWLTPTALSLPLRSLPKLFALSGKGYYSIRKLQVKINSELMKERTTRLSRSFTVCLRWVSTLSRPIGTRGHSTTLTFFYLGFGPMNFGGYSSRIVSNLYIPLFRSHHLQMKVWTLLSRWRPYETNFWDRLPDPYMDHGESYPWSVPCFDWALHLQQNCRGSGHQWKLKRKVHHCALWSLIWHWFVWLKSLRPTSSGEKCFKKIGLPNIYFAIRQM